MSNTFVALATPYLSSAIAIIRINGDQAYEVVNKIVDNKLIKKGYSVQKLFIYDKKNIIDEAIFVKFVSPRSFTGDDIIEINCHGGPIIIDKIINLLLKNGARLAEPGEFTKRAFLNNKLSLMQANSINNLINAKTESLTKLAINNLTSSTSNKLFEIKNKLFNVIGKIEVNIDYPEYDDVEVINHNSYIKYLEDIVVMLNQIINNYESVKHIYNGINVAIIGKPNVGKSSLLNSLLKKDKAIVSNIAGTTRDIVNDSIIIDDILYNFIDTAGIRESKNKIEKIGVQKSLNTIKDADFIIFLIDSTKKISSQEQDIIKKIKNKKYVIVKNKIDLKNDKNKELTNTIEISAKKNNIESLLKYLKQTFKVDLSVLNKNQYIASNNELNQIKNIKEILSTSISFAKDKIPLDVLLHDITKAYKNFAIFLGESSDFDILDDLFKNFCLGK
ncbi:tRNA uridine-5-carboxymethylaminomethyl(34) synthesis GTPase MnmE [Malacoplasma muris]|uniref:tRNA uridine-5-carboxymethylaminomethyl(34) synthesis GTPase MnmE n=1 Tax=Malacoplasma muris TaxID=2119 RepID=UPI00398EA7A8